MTGGIEWPAPSKATLLDDLRRGFAAATRRHPLYRDPLIVSPAMFARLQALAQREGLFVESATGPPARPRFCAPSALLGGR